MASRERVFDDPLASMFSGADTADSRSPADKAPTFVKPAVAQEPEVLKGLDASKIHFKEKKVAATPAPAAPVTTKGDIPAPMGAAKGLGFATSLWENDNSLLKPKDDILAAATISTEVKIDDNSIFASKQTNDERNVKSSDDIFAGVKRTPIPAGNSLGKVNINGFADDEKIDDLTVGKILDKEDELDFNLFGKSNVIQARSQGVALHQVKTAVNSITKNDLEVASEDVLEKMAAVTIEKEKTPISSVFAATAAATTTTIEPPSPTIASVNVNSLGDIDAYIASESASGGGGLFD